MIIKDIRLINFGKFKNKTVSIEPGVNIVYGENEAGKTTLHTFIRGMLFGIEKQRGKAGARDVYTKYQPWDNPSNYQGMLRIERNGTDYRIERNFDKEHKAFRVIDEEAGRELSENEIEEVFSGLDEGCYYNTISISQMGSVTDKELEVILKNYAANLSTTKSMEIDIKEAITDLEAQKRKIISDNKIGEEEIIKKAIDKAKEQLDVSEHEQQVIIASIEQKKEAAARIANEKKELSVLDSKRLEELAKQNERKDSLYQEVLNFTADTDKYNASLEEIKIQKKYLKEKLEENGIDGKDTMELITGRVLNRTNMPVLFIILMMACIGAAIGFTVGNYQFISLYWYRPAICAGGALFFLVLAIIKYFINRSRKNKKLEVLKNLKLVMDKFDAAQHEEVYIQRQLNNKKEALEKVQNLLKTEEDKDLTAKDYSEEIRQIEEQEREINEAISKAQWILEQKKESDIETDKRIEELTVRYDSIKRAKTEIEAIEQAKINIEEIAGEVRNSFGKKLNERASYYMAQITNGKYDNLSIDERMNISINGKHSLLPTSKLSKGTIEQIYMSLRLAAADIIFEKEKMPILLDDAFVMYDNKRMGNTMKFMAENMEQVVIFSCHTREKVMADKLGIKYNFIRL